MQAVPRLSNVAGVPRFVQQGQNPSQPRHQIGWQLPRPILLGQGAKPLVPDPHGAIVPCNVARCNI